MKESSLNGKPFTFSFASCNQSIGKSDGIVRINKALLRSKQHNLKDRDILLNFFDVDLKENRMCYQPLILSFNNQRVKLQ